MKSKIWQYMQCTLGGFLFVCGVNVIISPLGLYNGGFTGMGQLISYVLVHFANIHIAGVDLSGIAYFTLNAPLFILAFKSMSKDFFTKTVYTVVLQTLLLSLMPIPQTPLINDMLASCIVGGIVSGAGVGIILLAGSSGGGQDILGVYFTKKIPGFSVGKLSLLVNFFVYGCCLLLFDAETVIYSLLYTAVMSYVTDKIHTQNINAMVIVITKKQGLDDFVIGITKRGITMLKGTGGYTKEDTNVGMIVLSKHEIPNLRRKLREFDSSAFIVVNEDYSVYGNFEKRLSA